MRKKTNHSNGSRNRSRGKHRSGGGGESLSRQKKHAQTQKEKYMNMARDALSNGDRVEAEYYFQHVEHYSRTLSDIIAKEPVKEPAKDKSESKGAEEATAEKDKPAPGNDNAEETGNKEEIPLPSSMLAEPDVAAQG